MATRQDEFERIAMPHTRSLLRVARRLINNAASAEDLVQETMLSAWRGFGRFQAGTNARAWLFRILMNAFYARARKVQPITVPLGGSDFPSSRDVIAAADIASGLEALPVDQRTVLLLGVVEGFTCQEMSEILSIPIGTVMSRLSRGREALRNRLAAGARCTAKEA